MRKTYVLVVNEPIPLHNRCREGLVSPMTRSTVLAPQDVGAYAGLWEEPQLDWGLPLVLGPPRKKETTSIQVEARCQVFYIRPGGQLEAEDAEADDREEEAPPIQDRRLEADGRIWSERVEEIVGYVSF